MDPKHTINEKSAVVLLLVDVVNDFSFVDGEKILKRASPIAGRLVRLNERARRAKVPVVHVKDNFGQWRSDTKKVLVWCLRLESPGRKFVSAIRPGPVGVSRR